MKKYCFLILLFTVISCGSKSDGIKSGTFELYENDSLIGFIYRNGNYQIEKYPENTELIARITHQTDSTYLLQGTEKKPNRIDSIIWLNKYKKIDEEKYKIIAIPVNSDIEYKYEGVLLRVSAQIDESYLKKLNVLNKK